MHRPVSYPACALCSFMLLFFVFSKRQEDLELKSSLGYMRRLCQQANRHRKWRCSSGVLPYARANSQRCSPWRC